MRNLMEKLQSSKNNNSYSWGFGEYTKDFCVFDY